LTRAQDILSSLSVTDQRDLPALRPVDGPGAGPATPPDAGQLSLFRESERDALDALHDLNLEKISPMDAFMWLAKIKKELKN